MKTFKLFLPLIVLGLVSLALLGFAVLLPSDSASAAPPAAPTPITSPGYSTERALKTFYSVKGLAADTTSDPFDITSFDKMDVQYLVDQGAVNTTTVTIQFSNDGVTWINGPALVSANAADASDITPFATTGGYVRFDMNVTNTNPVTWTIVSLFK